MAEETLSSPPIKIGWFVGILAAFAVFALIALYSARMAAEYPGYDAQRAQVRLDNLAQLRSADQQTLASADWIDQGKGTVRIPIDEAMSEEVASLRTKSVQMGVALPNGAPPVAATTLPARASNPPGNAGTQVAPAAAKSPSTPNK